MSLSAKQDALTRIHGHCERAGRLHENVIMDEFCVTCGYHRKAAVRLLNLVLRSGAARRSGPKVIYDRAQVVPVFKAVWLASEPFARSRQWT
jgi:ribosomal protein L37E